MRMNGDQAIAAEPIVIFEWRGFVVVPGSIIYRRTISASKKLRAVESLLKRLGLKSGSSDS